MLLNLGVLVFAGVEYIISDTIFEKLPPEEQKLWHSHTYEVLIILSVQVFKLGFCFVSIHIFEFLCVLCVGKCLYFILK